MILLALLALLSLSPVEAKPPPENRVYWSSLNAVHVSPMGMDSTNRVMMQQRLWKVDSFLWDNTFAAGGLTLKLSPTMTRFGPALEVQPITLFNLKVGYDYVAWFGNYGYLQSWPEPTSWYAFDAADRDIGYRDDLYYSSTGHHLYLRPTAQLRWRRLSVRSETSLEYWNVSLEDGDLVFYDATLHTLVPGDGTVLTNESELLYVGTKHLSFGVRYSGVFPKYEDNDFQDGSISSYAIDGSYSRIGPVLAWTFKNREYKLKGLNKPTLLLVGGWYLKHPNEVESAIPYVMLGYSFTKELFIATEEAPKGPKQGLPKRR